MELTQRKKKVLQTVVDRYIRTAASHFRRADSLPGRLSAVCG